MLDSTFVNVYSASVFSISERCKLCLMLRAFDLVVALWLAIRPDRTSATFQELAGALEGSPSQVHGAVRNLRRARLADEHSRRIHTDLLLEFLVHGVRFVFPARPGPPAIGVPTAHSAAPLRHLLHFEDEYVWPHEQGDTRGLAVLPLHKSVPTIARRDEAFHELLALTDALRVGRARERAMATDELTERLSGAST